MEAIEQQRHWWGRRRGRGSGSAPAAVALAAAMLAALAPHASGAAVQFSPQPAWGPDRVGGYASDRVIIKIKPGVTVGNAADGKPTLRMNASPTIGPASLMAAAAALKLEASLRQWNVASIKPLFAQPPSNRALAAKLGLDRYYRVSIPRGSNAPLAAAAFRAAAALIESAEIDGLGGIASTIPDDPDLFLQWGLFNIGQMVGGITGLVGADISGPEAWDISTGSAGVTLAVLDSGVNPHEELGDRLLEGYYVIDGSSDTEDGCFTQGHNHGTHVAGIAAATGDNGFGIAGVDWSVLVLPVRVLEACTVSSTVGEANTAEGVVWATDHGAHVANMSLQFFAGTAVLHDALIYAHASGVVLVAAAGNQDDDVAYPAKWPECIAVAATNNLDQRWSFSNYGPEIDVAAPGVDIWSLNLTSDFAYIDGTSMSTAFVSGLACLILSIDPSLTPDEVRAIIQGTADDLSPAGWDQFTGHGRINAFAALQATKEGLCVPADLNCDGFVNGFDLAPLLAQWGPCPGCPADLDASGGVNGLDLAILLGAWG